MLQLTGNNYLLRTPLYPVQDAYKCFEGDLEDWLNRDEFLYGLCITSRALYEEYQKQRKAGRLTPKMRQSLQKYWLRASTRCTPYANFASCSLGTISAATHMVLDSIAAHRESCRLDMDLVYKFLEVLYRNNELKQQILLYPNNTLYRQGRKYRYVRYRIANGQRRYVLSEVAYSSYLDKIIQTVQKGSTLTELAAMLVAYGSEPEDALGYLQALLENQVLSSELEPCISGQQPFHRLSAILKKYPASQSYAVVIDEINELLLNNHFSIRRLQQVIRKLESVAIDHTQVTTLFQSDVYAPPRHNTLSETVVKQLLQEIDQVVGSFQTRKKMNDQLDQFKSRFLHRYEMQEVPLCEALDVEYGIGYGSFSNNTSPFVSDLDFSAAAPPKALDFSAMVRQKLAAYYTASASGFTIELTEEDLRQVCSDQPDTISNYSRQHLAIMGSLYGRSQEAIDMGQYQFFIRYIYGPSGANLLGRFCHLDPDLRTWVSSITRGEQDALPQDIVYAEIIHLPQERTGNVLLRPVLRTYEIPYLGNSGAQEEYQLPLSDLTIAVRNNLIVLRSRKLKKYIIPRLTTAHNFTQNSLPMYQFLCELQYQQGFSGISFDGLADNNAASFPRITYGHLILRRATWRLLPGDLHGMPATDHELIIFMETLRTKRKLPQQFLLVQFDNELLIDLRFPDAARMLASYIKKDGAAMVVEFPGVELMGAVEGDAGNYCNELLFPAFFENGDGRKITMPSFNKKAKPQRSFLPGNEWLYFKIYGGIHAAEEMLSDAIRKLGGSLLQQRMIDKFFFLRYVDPDPHIRLRFRLTGKEHFLPVTQAVNHALSKYIQQKMITGIQIDTYVREVERYGDHLITEAESIFFYDSQAVLAMLHILFRAEEEEKKWEIAMMGIDAYLNDFGYHLQDKIRLLMLLQQSFLKEFGGSKSLQLSLNNKYRALTGDIFRIFKGNNDSIAFRKCREALQRRSEQNKPVVQKIKAELKKVAQSPDELLGSYLHMFINRLFATENKKYELTLFHLLLKYFSSVAIINNKGA